jgi:hypothetical protein
MTIGELLAMAPAADIAASVFRYANAAGVCYAEIRTRIAVALDTAFGQARVHDDILCERARQVAHERFDAAHDDALTDGALAQAAAAYAYHASLPDAERARAMQPMGWPFSASVVSYLWPHRFAQELWKPKDRRHDLVRAAALLLAEIERLDRAAARESRDV